jgi:hypothetical protein
LQMVSIVRGSSLVRISSDKPGKHCSKLGSCYCGIRLKIPHVYAHESQLT